MPTLIIAGDATTGLVQSAAVDGALNIQTGPAGSKVNAIALASNGAATFTQITGGVLTLATTQATTSGTAIDFTGIPAWVKRITVLFNGVSTNGVSTAQVQIGAGSITTTGYASSAATNGSSLASFTTGFPLGVGTQAAYLFAGTMTIVTLGSNIWVMSGAIGTGSFANVIGGSVTLAGTLDRLRLTTVTGADVFDAGSVNIMYEG